MVPLPMRLFPDRGPWRNPAFRRVWSAAAVSTVGSRITRTALPIIAVSTLAASPRAAALLGAMSYGPGAVIGLIAGGWVDRRRKRTLLVIADLLRAALVLSLPLAHAFGALRLPHLYVVAAVVGAASTLFYLTELSYLPELFAEPGPDAAQAPDRSVGPGRKPGPPSHGGTPARPAVGASGDELIDANGISQATESVAEITGPAVAGGLIRAIGAPLAVTLDALSYLWSASFLRGLPDVAPAEASGARRPSIVDDLRIGCHALWRDPLIRRLALAELGTMLASGTFLGLYMLFALRELAIGQATLGIIIGFGGVGALLGALLAPRLAQVHATAWLAPLALVAQAAALLIPAATGGPALVVGFLIVHQLVGDGARTAYGVIAISLRQRRLAAATMGRANAALHAVGTALLLVAALGAGELAERLGLRTAMWIGMATGGLAVLPLLRLPPVTPR